MTTTLLTRDLGQTGVRASVAGFGAMHFDHIDDEATVSRLLNGVLDLGINLIDTARGYGRSEERIGRHLAHRRREFMLSTKFGYGVDGVPDWTYDCIVRGVERALRLLATEAIDVGFLHSCPLETLQRGEVTQALDDCVRAGKLRFAGYSGENAALAHALADPRFAVVQASVSLVDRANIALLANATNQGMLIKRSLAGLAWQRAQRPSDFCEGEYWDRWQALTLADMELPWPEIALRFAAHHSGGHCVLVGSQRLENIASSIEAISRGPLSPEMLARLDRAWLRADRGWPGIV